MCDPVTIGLFVGQMAAGAVSGGIISSASGGDFGKGMLMGALTGGIGVAITRTVDVTTGNGQGMLGKETDLLGNQTSSTAAAPTSVQQIQSSTSANKTNASTTDSTRRAAISAMASQGVKTSMSGVGFAETAKKSLLGQ